jgi:ankyrin repeat protein
MLRELPPTLDATYTRMLERIRPVVREDALTLLRWLAYAARPVTLAELQTAVTIRPEDDEVDFEDEGDFRDSLNILAGPVVFSDDADSTEDSEDTEQDEARLETKDPTPDARVRLAHFSVKEYLESARISGSPASFFRLEAGACHRFLAQSCLTYIMSYSKSGERKSPRLDLDKFHLLNYATDKWYQHSRLQSGDDVSREVALLECEDAMIAWIEIDCVQSGGLRLTVAYVPLVPSICYAAYLRLPRVVNKLLEAGNDANAVGPYNKPLLVVATENKDQTTVELLLAHGADVDMIPIYSEGDNALRSAASRSLLLTKLLVDNGADVNIESYSGTALSAACEANDQSVVKFLLESGARIDTAALTSASSHGHAEIVKLLLAKGADVNNSRALIEAAGSGHTDVVAVLSGAGADINAKDSGALLVALEAGHEEMVALLETKGAKKLTLEQLNKTLILVCNPQYHGRQRRAVELMLDRGADVSAEDSSALLGALRYGQEDLVALLEAKGAKKPTLEQLGRSLISACNDQYHRCLKIAVELMLDRGADVSAKDSSALLDAIRSGQEDTVALLEAKGANKPTLEQLNIALIEVRGTSYHWNFKTVVQMLLDRGADSNAADPDS